MIGQFGEPQSNGADPRPRDTMTRPDDLVHFGRPPLSEIALSIQFESIGAFSYADIGGLKDHFASSFPRVEYHPALPPMFETFGPRSVFAGHFQFQFANAGGIPRIWLLDIGGAQVLQFQPDRLTRNWRKTGDDDAYPHYENVRKSFLANIADLERFLADRKLGTIVPTQCEITYVNQINASGGYANMMAHAFSNWRDVQPSGLGLAETVSFNTSFVLPGPDDSPRGRIYFEAGSGFDAFGNPTVQFTVVGRGAPISPTIDGAAEFLDLVHDRIVRGFIELTTAEIQAEWGLNA